MKMCVKLCRYVRTRATLYAVTLYEHVCKDWTNPFQERARTKSSDGGIKFGEDWTHTFPERAHTRYNSSRFLQIKGRNS